MPKEVVFSVRISADVAVMMSNYLNRNNLEQPAFIRKAIVEKLEKEDKKFLDIEIKKHEECIESLKKGREILKLKEKALEKLPQKEREFLLHAAERLEKRPQFVDGLTDHYKNKFKKHYPISTQEFYKLMEAAKKIK